MNFTPSPSPRNRTLFTQHLAAFSGGIRQVAGRLFPTTRSRVVFGALGLVCIGSVGLVACHSQENHDKLYEANRALSARNAELADELSASDGRMRKVEGNSNGTDNGVAGNFLSDLSPVTGESAVGFDPDPYAIRSFKSIGGGQNSLGIREGLANYPQMDLNAVLVAPDASLHVKGTTGGEPAGVLKQVGGVPGVPVPPPASKAAPTALADAATAGRGLGRFDEAEVGAGKAPANTRLFARLPAAEGLCPPQDEELWVIQRYCPPEATRDADGRIVRVPQANDDYPGCGALVATLPGQTSPVPVPLKHTAVLANVAGNIASVSVTQQYHNPFSSKIEAVYVFPLPENAAVSDFVMKIGERTIRGVIRDRAQAEQIYADARAQGHVASLMTQERPNIFTQKVANIEPSKQIDVSVTYYNTLAYVDGSFEFVFPMVVGPRFNPAATYDGIGAAARGAASNASGQGTQVTYLRPTERSGTDISVNVNIDAGVAIESLECRSHVATISRDSASASRAVVTLSNRDSVPNKDFVLRYKVAGSALKTGMVTYRDKDGTGYFSLLVVPPADPSSCRRAPVEMVFVLDCSGSMNGRPIEQATAALERGLRRLQPGDTFQVINFAQAASQMGPAPVEATDENIRRGVEYSKSLFAGGGTYMITGLRAALDFPHDPRRLRYVCFLTDGYIGNEQEILGEINARLGSTRIFSFGVGTSTNRYLLDSMAKLGRGCVAHVAAGDSPTEIVDRFFDRISRPALTDVSVDLRLGDLEFAEVFPRRIPDVYSGRAVVINGRFKERSAKGWQGVVVRGSMVGASSGNFEATEMGAAWDDRRTHPALPAIWARHKIGDMADYATAANAYQLPEAVKSIALQYGLLSNYTAFIAVDSMSQTAGTYGTTVQVPVNVPEGVNYQTTVPER